MAVVWGEINMQGCVCGEESGGEGGLNVFFVLASCKPIIRFGSFQPPLIPDPARPV